MTYFNAGKFCFNFPTIPIYFFRPRPTLPTDYPYHMACDVNLVISIIHWEKKPSGYPEIPVALMGMSIGPFTTLG